MIRRGIRHIKEGFVGVYRHAAMSVSSCFAVTVTLILIGLFLIISSNLQQITIGVEGDLQISVLVDHAYDIQKQIETIEGIESIEFSTKDQELEYFLSLYGEEERELYMPDGADNPMPNTFYVKVKQGNLIESIDEKISLIEGVSETNYGGDSIILLVDILEGLRLGGLILVVGITLLSIFLVHNTIKLAISARKREISIMRNVGARNGYIRAPFLVEGLIIGFVGSIIPCILIFFGYYYIYDATGGQIMTRIFKLIEPTPFCYFVMLILIGIGMVVGFIGSAISVSRFLRWKR